MSGPVPVVSIEVRTITLVDGRSVTGQCYEHTNAGYPSGDWLMLDRQAGWVLHPHYRVASVTPEQGKCSP